MSEILKKLVKYNKTYKEFWFYNKKVGGYTYHIGIEQLSTKEGFLDFIYHLTEKIWISPEVMYDFLEVADEAFKYEYKDTVRGKLGCYGGLGLAKQLEKDKSDHYDK